MALSLLSGPANAGKVSCLLERYAAALSREPILIVPNRSDVERVDRELLTREGALMGGWIGTFDDLFERIVRSDGPGQPVAGDAQQALVLERAIEHTPLDGLSSSGRSAGFMDTVREAIGELGAGLVEPERLQGPLGGIFRAYRGELRGLGLWDRDLLRERAIERLTNDLEAWRGQPLFAYGFEDLTAAEWGLLRALAGRTEVTVSLPYEPGRPVFASLEHTAEELASLAAGRVEELPPRYADVARPELAFLERALYGGLSPGKPPPLAGGIRFLEAAGTRSTLELVGDEILELVRSGTPAERIGVVCPSLERWRAPVASAFGGLGIHYALEGRVRFGATPFGHALLGLLRFAWLNGERADLFAYLRSPFSGLKRGSVDFVEGRLRGRAVAAPERVEEEMHALRGAPLPALDRLREAPEPLPALRETAGSMLRAAYGLERPPTSEDARQDLAAYERCIRLVVELEDWDELGGTGGRNRLVTALERESIPGARPGEPGRVAVTDLPRARTRRFDVVFVLGLEEGRLPRRERATPLLDEEVRAALGPRLMRTDPVARDRYLFYTACTRPTRRLYLVREAASDDGSPLEPSPFYEEVASLFSEEDVRRWRRRRPLSSLTWPLEDAPTERERLRALAALTSDGDSAREAGALARANGWQRRLDRARAAFRRPTRLGNPLALAELRGRTTFGATELERFADCSSAWFIDRVIDPKTIDAEVDARLRGSVAHAALHRFFAGLPRELGTDRVEPQLVEAAVSFMLRCLDTSIERQRIEMTDLQRRELREGLARDLEQFVRDEARSEGPLVPRRFEVSFGAERSAPELQRGLELGDGLVLSGKIDRIDVDPFSARGIVQDYKAGKGAHSAREIERELRLQIPLYMLVLRDLVGLEPLGGVYRPLAGDRKPRGLLRAGTADDALPGYAKTDYLDEEAFWGQVEGARNTARRLAHRIRGGDVRHDPRGGECPSWCDLWPMCRVPRP